LAGLSTRLEGELLGLEAAGSDAEAVKLRLSGKEGDREVSIPRSQIRKANLLFEWGGESKGGERK
jgi:hypothetical protein